MSGGINSIACAARAPARPTWAAVLFGCLIMLAAAAPAIGATTRHAAHGTGLGKLDGRLQLVLKAALAADRAAAGTTTARRLQIALTPEGLVSVDVYVSGDVARAEQRLRALGMRVGAVSRRAPTRVVEGYLSPGVLAPAARLASTRAI